MSRINNIVAIAKSFVGIIEKPGNTGWVNKAFYNLMLVAGWYMKAPWCMFFAKSVYLQAYAKDPVLLKVVKNCFTGGAVDTYNRVKANGTFKVSQEPVKGAIVIYKHGNGPSGHAAIVIDPNAELNTIQNVEGNTNANGSREGDRVAVKLRTKDRPFTLAGLNVVGYIHPID